MNFISWVLLIGILVLMVLAIHHTKTHENCESCKGVGSCSSCSHEKPLLQRYREDANRIAKTNAMREES